MPLSSYNKGDTCFRHGTESADEEVIGQPLEEVALAVSGSPRPGVLLPPRPHGQKAVLPPGGSPTDVIVGVVSATYGITADELLGSRRSRPIATARRIAMYLVRTDLGMSLPEVGRIFRRDHTTVIHACVTLQRELNTIPKFHPLIEEIREQCAAAIAASTQHVRPPEPASEAIVLPIGDPELELVLTAVGGAFECRPEEVLLGSPRWCKELVQARELAIYILREDLDKPFAEIAPLFRRQPAKLHDVYRKLKREIEGDAELGRKVAEIRTALLKYSATPVVSEPARQPRKEHPMEAKVQDLIRAAAQQLATRGSVGELADLLPASALAQSLEALAKEEAGLTAKTACDIIRHAAQQLAASPIEELAAILPAAVLRRPPAAPQGSQESHTGRSVKRRSGGRPATGRDEDPLYERAKRAIIEAGETSISDLERRLKVGFERARRIMELLEQRGVIGPKTGGRPRKALTPQDEENTRHASEVGRGQRKGVATERHELTDKEKELVRLRLGDLKAGTPEFDRVRDELVRKLGIKPKQIAGILGGKGRTRKN